MKGRNLFLIHIIVEFGLTSAATSFGAPWLLYTPVNFVASKLLEGILGYLVDKEIMVVDLGEDAIKAALERKEYRDAIQKAYAKATARVYTEEEKVEIRNEFEKIIEKYGPVSAAHPKSGSVSDGDNTER